MTVPTAMTDNAATTSILIVDDLPDKLLAYCTVLEELGQNVVTAGSGAEALKQVLRNDFAVILLDVNMPDMDGFETARLIRQRRASAHVPIIFLTAFADEVRTAEGYATGGVDYLPTPVVPEILQAKVRVFVELHQMRQQIAQKAEDDIRRAAAEAVARRTTFLAEASRAISGSLDIETTLREIARAAVPFLADAGLVGLLDHGRQPNSFYLDWVQPGPEQMLSPRTAAVALRRESRLDEAVRRAAETGQTVRLTRVSEDAPFVMPGHASDDRAATGLAPPPLAEAVVIPLAARGIVRGTLVLAHGSSGRQFDPHDASLAEDFAARAAIALDNALLVRDIQDNDHRKDEFLAMLAHELRNPLAPIRTGLELLARTGSDLDTIAPMQRQVEHLVRLVDDLLDVSRITRGVIELRRGPVDLRSVVEASLDGARNVVGSQGAPVEVDVGASPLTVQGDAVRLTQAVTNLIGNAAKFTPRDGSIAVRASREDDEVVLRIRDSGSGISEELLPRVFDLFMQGDTQIDRSQGGLGIGLTLVRRIVELHGGRIEAGSDGPGKGSEFVVALPAVDRTPVPTTSRNQGHEHSSVPAGDGGQPLQAKLAPTRILVVDDNVDAARTLAALLKLGGHDVKIVHDGPTAVEAAIASAPSVVLLDIGLPGLDGYAVARELRRHSATAQALIIAVSGYGQDEDRRRSRAAGFDAHLTKPVAFEALYGLLAGDTTPVPAGH